MSTGLTICLVSSGIGIIALAILIVTSFSQLEVNEVGLDYSGITKTIDKNIFTAGIHFLGVAHSFIKFPITVQTYEFSKQARADNPIVKSRTRDGLEVEIEVSFQYHYITNSLYDLYMKFGTEYRTPCMKIAIDVITDQSTKFEATRFFFDKENISSSMQTNLNKAFTDECFSSVDYFQLKSIDLPDEYEKAIQETEVKKQDIHKAEAEKIKMQIELETKVKQAVISSQIRVNAAEGEAKSMINQNEAQALSFYEIQKQEAMSYKSLKDGLKLDGPQLITYMKAKVLKELPQENLIIGLE